MSGDFGMAQRAVMAALLVALYGALCGAIWWREARRRRQARAEAEALATAQEGAQPLLVAYASQTGQAEELARETARVLHAAGEPVQLCALDAVDAGRLRDIRRALFVASTYGEGDAPDNAVRFQSTVMAAGAGLAHLQYAVLALGDRQGLEVIAEGVETGKQMQFLRAHGCDMIQGNFFGRPMPLEEAARFIGGRRPPEASAA